ncbi:MAG: hypothetical protein WBB95_14625, partial [Pseudomonas sp.]
RCVSQQIHQLIHRLREQARSHIFYPVRLQISARCHTAELLFCGSWLVGSPHRCDAGTSVHQAYTVDAIAGKPAPTEKQICFCS